MKNTQTLSFAIRPRTTSEMFIIVPYKIMWSIISFSMIVGIFVGIFTYPPIVFIWGINFLFDTNISNSFINYTIYWTFVLAITTIYSSFFNFESKLYRKLYRNLYKT